MPTDTAADVGRAFAQWVDCNPLRQWRLAQYPKVPVLQAASRLGVSLTVLQLWERGVHTPGPANMAKLVRLLGSDTEQDWARWLKNKPGQV